jgi:hypothetical protein
MFLLLKSSPSPSGRAAVSEAIICPGAIVSTPAERIYGRYRNVLQGFEIFR